jgi:hypothetical protein
MWSSEITAFGWLAVAFVAAIPEVSIPHFGSAFVSAGAVSPPPSRFSARGACVRTRSPRRQILHELLQALIGFPQMIDDALGLAQDVGGRQRRVPRGDVRPRGVERLPRRAQIFGRAGDGVAQHRQ